MIQLIFTMLAAACWAVMSHLQFHNKRTTPFKRYTFFGSESWKRKYKRAPSRTGIVSSYDLYAAPDNWYYDFFGVKYKEKFPWSATALVFITDGYHLAQWFMIKFILLAMTVTYNHSFHFDWIGFLLLWAGWTVVFNVVFVRLKK